MNFTEAIKCLLEGKRVRSVLWHQSYFIELEEDDSGKYIVETSNDIERGIRFPSTCVEYHEHFFSFKDVTNEWELYDGEIMPLYNYENLNNK